MNLYYLYRTNQQSFIEALEQPQDYWDIYDLYQKAVRADDVLLFELLERHAPEHGRKDHLESFFHQALQNKKSHIIDHILPMIDQQKITQELSDALFDLNEHIVGVLVKHVQFNPLNYFSCLGSLEKSANPDEQQFIKVMDLFLNIHDTQLEQDALQRYRYVASTPRNALILQRMSNTFCGLSDSEKLTVMFGLMVAKHQTFLLNMLPLSNNAQVMQNLCHSKNQFIKLSEELQQFWMAQAEHVIIERTTPSGSNTKTRKM